MRYLSIDLEATGLNQNDLIIEFGMIPFDTESACLQEDLSRHFFIQCPTFEDLRPRLDKWVIDHNEALIRRAHGEGIALTQFRQEMQKYLERSDVQSYFKNPKNERIALFGKSMNAIDLPFLERDLGWDFMRKNFHHRILDLTPVSYALVDLKILPPECTSGSELMKYLGHGEVAHTALADAKNTALMYLTLLKLFKKS